MTTVKASPPWASLLNQTSVANERCPLSSQVRPKDDLLAMQAKSFLFGLCLTALAGWVDAIAFIKLSGLYSSFMSGNTTQIGFQFAHGDLESVLLPLALIAAFFSGAVLGGLLDEPTKLSTAMILLLEAILICCAWLLSADGQTTRAPVVFLAMAMGTQNVLLSHLIGGGGVTYVTGALFQAGRSFADWTKGSGRATPCLMRILTWFVLMVGAAGGATACARHEVLALGAPALFVLASAMIAAVLAARPVVKS